MDDMTKQLLCSGASAIGTIHEDNGTVCQDAWAKHIAQDVLAVCVCDGAGNAKFSQYGAAKTSAIVSEWLAVLFEDAFANPQSVFSHTLDNVLSELRKQAKELSCELRELQCTVVAAAVHTDGRYVFWHLGDGGIIARFGSELRVLSTPKKGDYANETFFITDSDAVEMLQFGVSSEETESITGLAVFSDGLEMLLYQHATLEVAPIVPKMFSWQTQADEETVSKAIADNLTEVFRTKTNDDCTLVLLNKLQNNKLEK